MKLDRIHHLIIASGHFGLGLLLLSLAFRLYHAPAPTPLLLFAVGSFGVKGVIAIFASHLLVSRAPLGLLLSSYLSLMVGLYGLIGLSDGVLHTLDTVLLGWSAYCLGVLLPRYLKTRPTPRYAAL